MIQPKCLDRQVIFGLERQIWMFCGDSDTAFSVYDASQTGLVSSGVGLWVDFVVPAVFISYFNSSQGQATYK